jgi:hypothetical protein
MASYSKSAQELLTEIDEIPDKVFADACGSDEAEDISIQREGLRDILIAIAAL